MAIPVISLQATYPPPPTSIHKYIYKYKYIFKYKYMMAANRVGGVPPSLATPPTILPTKHKVSHTPLPGAHGPLSPALSFSHIYFYCCAPAECEPPSPFHARCCEAERLTADLSRSPRVLPLQAVCNVIGRRQQYHSGRSRRKPRIIFKMGLIKKKGSKVVSE